MSLILCLNTGLENFKLVPNHRVNNDICYNSETRNIRYRRIFTKKMLKVNKELRKINESCDYSRQISLLRSIPGIGLIIALTIMSELETHSRFKNFDQLCSYFGLVPTTNSSGEHDKVGNMPLRTVIIEAAWTAIRHDPAMSLKYIELTKRKKGQDAIVRIAKKLLNRIKYVLKNEKEYVCSVV